jgi:hypothetical protein
LLAIRLFNFARAYGTAGGAVPVHAPAVNA